MLRSCWFHRSPHDLEQMVVPEPPRVRRVNTQEGRGDGTACDARMVTGEGSADGVLPDPPLDAIHCRRMLSSRAAPRGGRSGGIPEGRSDRDRSTRRGSWSDSYGAVMPIARWRWNHGDAAPRQAWTRISATTLRKRGDATHSSGARVTAMWPGSGPALRTARSGSPQPVSVRRSDGPCETNPRFRFDGWPCHVAQRQRPGPRTPFPCRSSPAFRGE